MEAGMVSYRYLIVGSGMTASAALDGIRRHDAKGSIGLFGAEPFPPYNRPPLSKGLWKGDSEDTIWRALPDGVDHHFGRRIVSLDVAGRTVVDDKGDRYGFERLLLATGMRTRRFPFDSDAIYFRTLDDYRRLRELATRESARFCVIGGGFIGSEIAAALALSGRAVTLLVAEPGIGARIYPHDLSTYLGRYYQHYGVEVLTNSRVAQIDRTGNGTSIVRLADGKALPFDAIVAGIGVEADVGLAAGAGLPVDNGILVDEFGRTGESGVIFAAGDVARFPNAALGRTLRVEHEDHALGHGLTVGANMAGASEPYRRLPFFYSDLFDLGYEAVGLLDARSQMIADWTEPYRTGVVYYLEGERVRGVLLWGIFGKVDEARALIESQARAGTSELIGRIRP
jgi:NADPH-dependent 2,4-dienoyl-CoA reductase/sulfur reductase-like enzyme